MLVSFDPFIKMSIKFVFPVLLILIPPSLSLVPLECFKCEERRDTNGTLISGNCMSNRTNGENIKVVNCLYKCSILHASDRKSKVFQVHSNLVDFSYKISSWTWIGCPYTRLHQKRGLLRSTNRKILKHLKGLLSYVWLWLM